MHDSLCRVEREAAKACPLSTNGRTYRKEGLSCDSSAGKYISMFSVIVVQIPTNTSLLHSEKAGTAISVFLVMVVQFPFTEDFALFEPYTSARYLHLKASCGTLVLTAALRI
jgi:hypothetical protein